jgi:hypothetical protein
MIVGSDRVMSDPFRFWRVGVGVGEDEDGEKAAPRRSLSTPG